MVGTELIWLKIGNVSIKRAEFLD